MFEVAIHLPNYPVPLKRPLVQATPTPEQKQQQGTQESAKACLPSGFPLLSCDVLVAQPTSLPHREAGERQVVEARAQVDQNYLPPIIISILPEL